MNHLKSFSLICLLTLAACGGSTAPAGSGPSAPQTAAASKPAVSSAPSASAKPAVSGSAATAATSAKPAASAGASAAAGGEALPKLTLPYTAISVSNAPVWIPFETGQFKKYGVDVSTEYIATSTTLTPAMLSGQVPMANNGEDAVINANLAGGDLVIVGAGINKFLFSVYSKTLNNPADLKGKRLGITKIGAATDFAARFVLAKNNLAPDKDVALLQMGGVPEILAGIESGAVDAGVVSPPTTVRARKLGLKQIANLADYDVEYYTAPIVAKRSWLKDHRDLALKVMQGYTAGIAVAQRDKATTMSIIGKYTKTDDKDVLEDAYASLTSVLPKAPLPGVAAIKTGLAQATEPAARTADPESFIDPSLIEELQKNGFIDSLYK